LSVVLALTGVALALLFRRGAIALVIGASVAVIGAYYACLVAGESLADRFVLSPFVAMWMANAVFLSCALLVLWWRSRGPIDTVTFGRAVSPSGPRA
jgi:lipopolysaccharide export system permease protein